MLVPVARLGSLGGNGAERNFIAGKVRLQISNDLAAHKLLNNYDISNSRPWLQLVSAVTKDRSPGAMAYLTQR